MSRSQSLQRLLDTQEWGRRLVFWGGAVVCGAITVVFALGSDMAMGVFRTVYRAGAWLPFVVMPLGLAVGVWMNRRWFPGSEGSGIPQTIAALRMREESARNQVLSLRIALGKMLVCLIALCSGASIGREGPTVQVSASIMHSLRRFARFSAVDLDRGLILAGGAAGVAAAFNTPLAGVLFAIEELFRSFEERVTGLILIAVVFAGVTSMSLVGDYTYFGITSATLSSPRMWVSVPVCGIVAGLCGGLFSNLMLAARTRLPRTLRQGFGAGPIGFACACGVLLAAIGWVSGGTTYGTGYAEARGILQQGLSPAPGFAALKALATIVSYVTGIPGGIFAPSLAVGAGIGGELYKLIPIAPAGAMVVLSMAAYFAGVVQAPLTALVIVLEMTNDRSLVLPIMAAALLGRAASALICREPLYQSLAKRYLQ